MGYGNLLVERRDDILIVNIKRTHTPRRITSRFVINLNPSESEALR